MCIALLICSLPTLPECVSIKAQQLRSIPSSTMAVSNARQSQSQSQSQLQTLIDINCTDLLKAFGLSDRSSGQKLLRPFILPTARRFAQRVMEYDRLAGEFGLPQATRIFLRHNVNSVTFSGARNLAGNGPLLIASNHPGLTDALALVAIVQDDDVRIVAHDRDFLRALPNIMHYLLIVSDVASERIRATRSVLSTLKAGCPVLTFPAGQIEPDPATMTGGQESLRSWSSSLDLFARLETDLRVVPAIVRGVISADALRNPLTRIRRNKKDRNWLAATLQIAVRAYQNQDVRVAFGEPVYAAHLTGFSTMTDVVKTRAQQLIESPPADWQQLPLI